MDTTDDTNHRSNGSGRLARTTPKEHQMKRIIEYTTPRDSNIKDLDRIVNKMIEQGNQRFGSPHLTKGGEFLACQAMGRYEEDSKP